MKKAFTLAEVLITLGIIGVVAALTVPVLMQKYRNHVVETRLRKIYTVMNQAILKSEAEYGAKELWDFSAIDFWDKYFAPHINTLKIEDIKSACFNTTSYCKKIYMTDGSLLVMKTEYITKDKDGNENAAINNNQGSNKDFIFYPNAKNFNIDTLLDKSDAGITFFSFFFSPSNSGYYHFQKGFQPYANSLASDYSNLYTKYFGCIKESPRRNYCTFVIYQNGWKIPNNYPFKVR